MSMFEVGAGVVLTVGILACLVSFMMGAVIAVAVVLIVVSRDESLVRVKPGEVLIQETYLEEVRTRLHEKNRRYDRQIPAAGDHVTTEDE